LGFESLQHFRNRRSTHAGSPARFVPPSGFGYPLGGLLPSVPCRFFFTPAALLGFNPSEHCPLKRYPGCYHPDAPTYRFTCRCSRRPKAWAGPNRLRFLGFDPPESPWRSGKGLVRRPLDAPLGFALPGSSRESLAQAFTRAPLTRFTPPAVARLQHRRPRVSIGSRLVPSEHRTEVQRRTGQPS
jgi:hypothetical protein